VLPTRLNTNIPLPAPHEKAAVVVFLHALALHVESHDMIGISIWDIDISDRYGIWNIALNIHMRYGFISIWDMGYGISI
jgi:hypothetical protein